MKIKSLFILLLVSSYTLFAQNTRDPKATMLLDKASKKYKSYASFSADFVFSLESAAAGINEKNEGNIKVMGDKYLVDLGETKIYNNGETVWTYLAEVNEVNIASSGEDEQMSPTQLLTIYENGYKYYYANTQTINGTSYDVIELTPEDIEQNIFKVKIFINKSSGLIERWKMFEKSGVRYTYVISNFKSNPSGVTANTFVFNKAKFPGVMENDMR